MTVTLFRSRFINNFVNLSSSIQSNGMRSYGDHYFTPQTRMKELYVWGNNFTNSSCGDTDEECWGGFNSCIECALAGIGENGNIHLRAPIQGERLYNFQATMLTYPHPWRTNPPDGSSNNDPGSGDKNPSPSDSSSGGGGCFVSAANGPR